MLGDSSTVLQLRNNREHYSLCSAYIIILNGTRYLPLNGFDRQLIHNSHLVIIIFEDPIQNDTFISTSRTWIYISDGAWCLRVLYENHPPPTTRCLCSLLLQFFHFVAHCVSFGICSFRMALQSSSPLQTMNANILNHLLLPCILLFLIIYSRWQRLGQHYVIINFKLIICTSCLKFIGFRHVVI